MARTFYEIIKAVINEIMDSRASLATGGTTATLVDTTLAEPDETFDNGTILIDLATPVIRQVISYDQPAHTFTFSTVATAPSAGTPYTVCDERFPLDLLKRAINQALTEDGARIMAIDESLTAVEDQENYELPDDVSDIRRVEIGTEDEEWQIHRAWREEGANLRFLAYKPTADDTIRILYAKEHDVLVDFDDEVDPQIPYNWLVHAACVYALKWRGTRVGNNEPNNKELINFHLSKAMEARAWKKPLLSNDSILGRF